MVFMYNAHIVDKEFLCHLVLFPQSSVVSESAEQQVKLTVQIWSLCHPLILKYTCNAIIVRETLSRMDGQTVVGMKYYY